jgi:hypothetical protein
LAVYDRFGNGPSGGVICKIGAWLFWLARFRRRKVDPKSFWFVRPVKSNGICCSVPTIAAQQLWLSHLLNMSDIPSFDITSKFMINISGISKGVMTYEYPCIWCSAQATCFRRVEYFIPSLLSGRDPSEAIGPKWVCAKQDGQVISKVEPPVRYKSVNAEKGVERRRWEDYLPKWQNRQHWWLLVAKSFVVLITNTESHNWILERLTSQFSKNYILISVSLWRERKAREKMVDWVFRLADVVVQDLGIGSIRSDHHHHFLHHFTVN